MVVLAKCGGGGSVVDSGDGGSQQADGPSGSPTDASYSASKSDVAAAPIDAPGSDAPSLETGSDAAPWTPALHACAWGSASGVLQYPPPPAGRFVTPCPGADWWGFSPPQVTGQDGGIVAAGTTATISLTASHADASDGGDAGVPYCTVNYPCLAVSTDTSGVTLSVDGPVLYCLSTNPPPTYSIHVTFAPSLAPGTRIHFAAWAVGAGTTESDGAIVGACYTQPFLWDVILS